MIYTPHPYQKWCIDFLETRPAAGLFLKPGMGKTSIALTAANSLMYDSFDVHKTLVIAPLRVAEDTWSRESAKWDHLRHLRISKVLGSEAKRRAALQTAADIYVINRENVPWLAAQCGRKWPFDLVIIDELSNFRNPGAKRFKALRRIRPRIKRLWGLTGTPRPRSLLDLWAQLYLMDSGERLGRTFTQYRSQYFVPGKHSGQIVYEWIPVKGAEEEIYQRVSDICVSLETQGNLQLPELVKTTRPVKLDAKAREQYRRMERDMLLEIDTETITAGSAGVLTGKLLQLSGGALYDESGQAHILHSAKLDALEDIIAEANGEPVLIAYRYRHELDRISGRFPQAELMKDADTIARWNAGEIPILLAHPASAGHGLNLQDGGHILVWYGPTYDLELNEQFNARLYRQGQRETTSIIYLVTEGTVEENAMESLRRKSAGQQSMLDALRIRKAQYTCV